MTTLKQSHDALLAALKELIGKDIAYLGTRYVESIIQIHFPDKNVHFVRQIVSQARDHIQAAEALSAQPEETCEWRIDECHYRRSSCDGSMRTARVEVDKFCPGCGKRIEVKQ